MSAPLEKPPLTVRFLLSHNLPGSITRIIADTASSFVRFGTPTSVWFPTVDWWDFKWFHLRKTKWSNRWRPMGRLALELLRNVPLRRKWVGLAYHRVDPRVKVGRFWVTPSFLDWRKGEVTVVIHSYQLPHVWSPHREVVSGVYVNYEKAMQSHSPEAAAWGRHRVALEQRFPVPRYACSEEARRAAERLGIPIQKVIYHGIDLKLFRPVSSPSDHPHRPLVVSLYCALHPQKGLDVGMEAIRNLKSVAPSVRLCSIGHLKEGQEKQFDHNYGYLHREAYAKAIQESDLFIYPSRYDGFPSPPLQAMSCGIPLVTTAVEGVTEYAVHEQNALLCRPGDSQALRRQILRLIEDRALRERFRENGPKTAQRFQEEWSAREFLKFLQGVYEGHYPSNHSSSAGVGL